MSQQADFQIVPGQDELDKIERELGFHPSQCKNPEALSREQLEQFNRDGYLSPIRLFTEEESNQSRSYFEILLDRVVADGGNSYSISTAHLTYGKVYDLLAHPRIVGYVKDLLGADVVGWGSHYFCKMPGDGKTVAWHQDASYWPLTPSKTVTVWLAIDDSDVENGCMRVIPGSHRHGHLSYRVSRDKEGNVLDQTVDNVEEFGEPRDVVLGSGEVSIHSDLLLHGSNANKSRRRRCGLTLRYCSADVRAHLDWNRKGVIVNGSDPASHWANPRRPVND